MSSRRSFNEPRLKCLNLRYLTVYVLLLMWEMKVQSILTVLLQNKFVWIFGNLTKLSLNCFDSVDVIFNSVWLIIFHAPCGICQEKTHRIVSACLQYERKRMTFVQISISVRLTMYDVLKINCGGFYLNRRTNCPQNRILELQDLTRHSKDFFGLQIWSSSLLAVDTNSMTFNTWFPN